MAELTGTSLRTGFTTACAASLPGPARIPRFEGKPAISGAALKQIAKIRRTPAQARLFLPQRKFVLSAERGRGYDWRPYKSKGARKYPHANLRMERAFVQASY